MAYTFDPDKVPDLTTMESPVIKRTTALTGVASSGITGTAEDNPGITKATLRLFFEPTNGNAQAVDVPLNLQMYRVLETAATKDGKVYSVNDGVMAEDVMSAFVPRVILRSAGIDAMVGNPGLKFDVKSTSAGTLRIDGIDIDADQPLSDWDSFPFEFALRFDTEPAGDGVVSGAIQRVIHFHLFDDRTPGAYRPNHLRLRTETETKVNLPESSKTTRTVYSAY